MGWFDNALKLYEEAGLQLQSKDNKQRVQWLNSKGSLLLRMGQFGKSEECLLEGNRQIQALEKEESLSLLETYKYQFLFATQWRTLAEISVRGQKREEAKERMTQSINHLLGREYSNIQQHFGSQQAGEDQGEIQHVLVLIHEYLQNAV